MKDIPMHKATMNLFPIFAMLFVAIFPIMVCRSSLAITVTEQMAQALELSDTGKQEEAIKIYEQIIRDCPKCKHADEAVYRKGLCLYAIKKHKEAISTWEELDRKYPLSEFTPEGLIDAGMTYVGPLDDVSKSIECFRKVVNKYRNSDVADKAQDCIAMVYYMEGKKKETIKEFQYLLEEFPKSEFVESAKKIIAECQGEIDKEKEKPRTGKVIVK